MTRKLLLCLALVSIALLLVGTTAQAADPHGGGSTGQPGQTCQDLGDPIPSPGNSANAPGSPFNANGVSGGVYAGTQTQNSNNPKLVSQYDVACLQQTRR
jgi:hypothetical protein